MLPLNDLIKLGVALAQRNAGQSLGRSSRRMAGMVLAGMIAVAGLLAAVTCALAALWIYLLPIIGAVWSLLVVAGILLVMSIGVMLTARHAGKPPRPAPAANVNPALLLAEITRLIKVHKGPVLLAALLAGLVAGSRET